MDKFMGLTDSQVIVNRQKYGRNEMPRPRMKTAWDFIKEVFHDKLNLVLFVMMLMFVGLGIAGYGSVYEAVGIGVVLLVVIVTTVMTKLKSQRSAYELYKKSSACDVTVVRNGAPVNLDSVQVVVDDIVILQAGEKICADGYVVDGAVDVNNAILNGESEEVKKTAVPKNYKYETDANVTSDMYSDAHSLFAGTMVLSGKCYMRVTRIGENTENAKIMSMLYTIDDVKTTLQIQLDKLALRISKIGSVCALVIFVVLLAVRLVSGDVSDGLSLLYVALSALTVALTIFVAAVPEGLPFIIGIITSQNVGRMIRSNILAKNPNKIPESGNVQLLCTDKTGTLTYGCMQAVHNYTALGMDIGFDLSTGDEVKRLFLQNIALTCGCVYDWQNNIIGGNSTCRALFGAVKNLSEHITRIQQDNPISSRLVFDSAYKFAAAQLSGTGSVVYYLGAPEVILAHAGYFIDTDGVIKKIDRGRVAQLIQWNAARSMRMVATAFGGNWSKNNELPDNLVFISLVAMQDMVRDGVHDVVGAMNKSGIQVMMITGDNLETARAIAVDCGIVSGDADCCVTSGEFEAMSDDCVKNMLSNLKVIARATPNTKLRLVRLAQDMNLCIGMCGDGTNDAPALKRADVGFAMGDGTDVCKEAGDIIIVDNNFLSVANCILLGRTFVHNVVGFLKFQLPINFTLVILSILFPILFGFEAFTAVQILLINIVMDSLNSFAFAGEPPRSEYLSEPSQGKGAPLLTRATLAQVLCTTIGFCLVFMLLDLLYAYNMFSGAGVYMSARFALLSIMAVVNGFCVRAAGYNIFTGLSRNPMFVLVALGIVVCTILSVTFGGVVLQLVPMSLPQWLAVFGLSCLIVPINFIIFACRKKC